MKAVEQGLLNLAVIALILLGVFIVAEIVLRGVFGISDPGVARLVPDLMVAATALPLAAATAGRAHSAVMIFSDWLAPGPRARLILAGHAMSLLVMLLFVLAAVAALIQALPFAGNDQTAGLMPDWPGIALFLAGFALMGLRMAMVLVADAREFRLTGTIIDEHGQGPF